MDFCRFNTAFGYDALDCDGDGARVKKVESTGTTAYAGEVEVAITGTLRITRTYYTAGTQLVALRVVTSTGGNRLYYLHADHPYDFAQDKPGQHILNN